MDKDKFWNYVNPLQDQLFKFAFSILKNREDAQDAVQDIFEKLWNKRRQIRWDRNLNAFAFKAMKNHCIDLLRRRNTIVNASAEVKLSPSDFNYENYDMVEIIKKRITQLPIQQQLIVELKDIQGYDYEEISQIMEIPVTTLRVMLSRARKFILNSLKDER